MTAYGNRFEEFRKIQNGNPSKELWNKYKKERHLYALLVQDNNAQLKSIEKL